MMQRFFVLFFLKNRLPQYLPPGLCPISLGLEDAFLVGLDAECILGDLIIK